MKKKGVKSENFWYCKVVRVKNKWRTMEKIQYFYLNIAKFTF